MPSAKTEERHDKAMGLDVMHPVLALRLLASGQQSAAKSLIPRSSRSRLPQRSLHRHFPVAAAWPMPGPAVRA